MLWGQGDLQHFNGDLDRLGMNYRGRLEAAHVGLDLYANDQVLAGLSFMRSWGDMDYTDDGVDGVLGSDLNTFHPYLYWEPNERVSMWGFGGMGWGEVDVEELGRTHDFDADFRALKKWSRHQTGVIQIGLVMDESFDSHWSYRIASA